MNQSIFENCCVCCGQIINPGQRKKLLRNPAICAMFERYGVETDEK